MFVTVTGIFVTASQSKNSAYSYNTVTVVLLTEVVKLLVSTALYCKE
jgi:integrin beta 8